MMKDFDLHFCYNIYRNIFNKPTKGIIVVSTSKKAREARYEDELTGDYAVVTLFVEDIFTDPDEYEEGAEWGVSARGKIYSENGEELRSVSVHLPYGFEKYEDALNCATDENLDWHEFDIFI
jgi:hypothetical protein